MSRSSSGSCLFIVAATAAGLIGAVVAAPSPVGAVSTVSSLQSAFGGVAFGSTGHLGALYRTGHSALLPLCTTKIGVTKNNDTQGSSAPRIGVLGSVKTQVATRQTGATLASVTTAKTGASHLFSGLVSGSAFTAVATASHAASGYALTGSTVIQDLNIAGHAMPSHPTVNQQVTLPNVGYVVLNQQSRSTSFGVHRLTVVAARIVVAKGNPLGVPAGTLVISSARASLRTGEFRSGSGAAYGTRVLSGPTMRSGSTAPSYLPCGGTSGATVSNSTGTVSRSGLLASAVHTTAHSTDGNAATTVTTTAEVTGVNLMHGAITANTITSQATARRGTGLSRSSTGTRIFGFTINGKTQPARQPANTKRVISGLGTLWIHRVVTTPTGLRVLALQLVLSKAQQGLSAGTVITVGGTYAAVAASQIG